MSGKRCAVCKKPWDVVELFEGIYDRKMVMVCDECAHEEKIPILKKPSLNEADLVEKRYSVRERMERLSGVNKHRTQLSNEQATVQHNLNRLKMPEKKQLHEDLVENYYWEVNMSRRRKKMTVNQLSKKACVPVEIIEAIERGKLPKNFEQYFVRLEDFFGITLLKHRKPRVNYIIPVEERERILNEVQRKLETKVVDDGDEYEELDKRQKKEKIKEISGDDFNLIGDEDLDNETYNDLVELREEKKIKERQKNIRKQTEDLLGDDLELV